MKYKQKVAVMNKFRTDKTKIYFVYRVDGHIYRSIDRSRERDFIMKSFLDVIVTLFRKEEKRKKRKR